MIFNFSSLIALDIDAFWILILTAVLVLRISSLFYLSLVLYIYINTVHKDTDKGKESY